MNFGAALNFYQAPDPDLKSTFDGTSTEPVQNIWSNAVFPAPALLYIYYISESIACQSFCSDR